MTLRAFFGDAERAFVLTAPLIAELEAVTGLGIGGLARRFEARDFKLDDITHTIRLALIGGGTDPATAARLVANYVPARPLVGAHVLAVTIMGALWFGTEEDIARPDEPNEEPSAEEPRPDWSPLADMLSKREEAGA